MEMNFVVYTLILLVALFAFYEVVSSVVTVIFLIWMDCSMKAVQKLAAKVVETKWFKDRFYLDEED